MNPSNQRIAPSFDALHLRLLKGRFK